MAEYRRNEIFVTIHGLKMFGDEARLITANVFKRKFQSLLIALEEADKTINAKKSHIYLVSHLAIGSAEFALLEKPRSDTAPDGSAINALINCADSIYRSSFQTARRYNGIAARLLDLCKGVNVDFDRMEISVKECAPIQIDTFFKSQVERFTEEPTKPEVKMTFFSGQSMDAFDGVLGEIDWRGKLWRGILVLSGTTKEIGCVFPGVHDSDAIAGFGNKRVWVRGNAIYDGTSELPARLEVSELRMIGRDGEPSKWKGVISSFEPDDWGSAIESIN